MSKKNWQTTSSEIVHQNPWYAVQKDTVIDPQGKPGEYYLVKTPGPSVFVIVVTPADEIVLIRQDRYQTDGMYWEIPGGNAGHEDPQVAAKRELQEETGYTVSELTEIGSGYPFNGAADEVSYFYLAREYQQSGENKQREEHIDRVKAFSIPQVLHMIQDSSIRDTQSISAIFFTLVHLGYHVQK